MAVITIPDFGYVSPSRPSFPQGCQDITPSDTDTFSAPVKVYVGSLGNVAVVPASGEASQIFYNFPAGGVIPVEVSAVLATGTTSTNLLAIY